VARDANLARQDHAFTDGRRPASPTWAQSSVFGLPSTHDRPEPGYRPWPRPERGLTDRGPVDARIRLHLDGIFKNRPPGLNNLVPAAIRLPGKAEAVGSHDGSILQNDIIAEVAMLRTTA